MHDRGTPAAVAVTEVTKRYDGPLVLDHVSVAVEAGKMLALLGPSGCGKTTLLRTIAGLEVPDSGSVTVGDRLVSGGPGSAVVPPEQRRVGMVFQDWALFPHLTVAKNVAYGLPRSQRGGARVGEALAMVGLVGLEERMPGTLSGGQQQRVALARALAPEPAVLLLDEPFSNLDTALRVQVRMEVHRLLAELGITTVFVTHDQEEAFVLGDEVAVMRDGKVVQQATPARLYDEPVDPWVATFVGEANLLSGVAAGTTATTAVGEVVLDRAHHGPVDVLLRPEELSLADGRGATVELVEFYGHDTVYVVHLDGGAEVRVRASSAPVHQRGDVVSVRFAGEPTVAFEPASAAG